MEMTEMLKQIPKSALLPEAVYQQLKSAILSGVFRPGQTLRQDEVAKQLGVSRGPLREALPKLEAEGMIISLPHRGCAVVSLAPDEIEELLELTAMLEASLARIATRRRDPETVQRLRDLHSRMGVLAASENQADRLRWFELNYELHTVLLTAAGRKHHLRILEVLRALAEPYIRMQAARADNLSQAQEEQARLIEEFAAGNCEIVANLTSARVQQTSEQLLSAGPEKHRPD
jgi:DNA-binding GntR family transcriptional regulator